MKHQKKPEVIKKPVWDEEKCSCDLPIWVTGTCDYCREFDGLMDQYYDELDAKANGGCDW